MKKKLIRDPHERFWRKVVDAGNGCWEWIGPITGSGYGIFRHYGGRFEVVHRFAWKHLRGDIPDGLVLDHICRNRACVNPEHLEPVTNRVNILRGESSQAKNAVKTHCKRGHEFTTENTRRHLGTRICRKCVALRQAERRRRMAVSS